MTNLLDLLPERPDPEPIGRDRPIDARFLDWIDRNPELLHFVTRRAIGAARSGAKRLSAKALIEEARSSGVVTVNGRRDWRIDNTYTAPLARYLMERHACLVGLFETRRRRAA